MNAVLIRTDTAGCAKAFLQHIRGLRRQGVNTFFSVGMPITQLVRDAIGHATAWIPQYLLPDGDLARAEPRKLRYRLLHTAARIVRTGRRVLLRLNASWPWADQLASAFHRLSALPCPMT